MRAAERIYGQQQVGRLPVLLAEADVGLRQRDADTSCLLGAEEGRAPVASNTARPISAEFRRSLTKGPNAASKELLKQNDRENMLRELEAMPQAAVSEPTLHECHWERLLGHFAVTVVPALVLWVLTLFTYQRSMALPLGLQKAVAPAITAAVFGGLVITGEVLAQCGGQRGQGRQGCHACTSSALLEALRGRRLLPLERASEVFALAQSLARSPAGATVGLVGHPARPREPPRILRLGAVEVLPGQYAVQALYSESRSCTAALHRLAAGEGHEHLSAVVERWLFEPHFELPCYVELRRIDWLQGLAEHWATYVMLSIPAASFFLMPSMLYIHGMQLLMRGYCAPAGPCSSEEEGAPCRSACGSFMHFAATASSERHMDPIEHVWTIAVTLVALFTFSIHYTSMQHSRQVSRFILCMHTSKQAEAEVLAAKRTLQDSQSFRQHLRALWRSLGFCCSGTRACGGLPSGALVGPRHIENPAFRQVLQPLLDMQPADSGLHCFSLPPADTEREPEDGRGRVRQLCTWEVKMQLALKECNARKNEHGLSGSCSVQQPAFKFLAAVPVTCRESLQILDKEFFQKAYASQLDAISAHPDCQDGLPAGSAVKQFAHVSEDFHVGSLLIPFGLCLTHVLCIRPDLQAVSLEIGHQKDIPDKSALKELLSGTHRADLGGAVLLETFQRKYGWPPILLPAAGGPPDEENSPAPLDASELGHASSAFQGVSGFFFVFQLSPQYFRMLKQMLGLEDMTLYTFVENSFARMLETPSPALVPSCSLKGDFAALRRQSWEDYDGTHFSFVVQKDKATLRWKVLKQLLAVSQYIGLLLLCALFVLIVPVWRYFAEGGALFPEPFTICLALNVLAQFVGLAMFLWLYSHVSMVLSLIVQALDIFEQRTLESSGPPPQGETAHSGSRDRNVFQLDLVTSPGDPACAQRWREKELDVERWHLCARYLRILTCGVRQTAEALLAASGVILLAMLALSVVQAFQGTGFLGVNNDKLKQELQYETTAMLHGAVARSKDFATSAAQSLADAMSNAAVRATSETGRRLSDMSFELENTSLSVEALDEALAPFDRSLEAVVRRLSLDLGTSLQKLGSSVSVTDIKAVSKCQLLTMCMTLLLLFYSGRLLWNIASVNDHVDKHESLLMQAKERHLRSQAHCSRSEDAAHEGGDAAGGAPSTTSASYSAGTKSESQLARETAASVQRYERMLDMSIQFAHDNKIRFPLRLFGLVINRALLFTWVVIAMQPLLHELKRVIPNAVMGACRWVDSSHPLLDLQAKLNGTEAILGVGSNGTAGAGAEHEPVNGVIRLFNDLVCTPLQVGAGELVLDLGSAYMGKPTGVRTESSAEAGRRLAARPPPLDQVIEQWWQASPGDPTAKLALVQRSLGVRARAAQRLLVAAPQAVWDAYHAWGRGPVLDAAVLQGTGPLIEARSGPLEL